MGANVHCDSLLTTEMMDAPALLYGTCNDFTPASVVNNTAAKWPPLPTPGEAIASASGLAFISAISSRTLLAATELCTASKFCPTSVSDTGSKSFSASYGIFL